MKKELIAQLVAESRNPSLIEGRPPTRDYFAY
jgi:hypothetical protein